MIVDLTKLKVLASRCKWCDSDVSVTHSFKGSCVTLHIVCDEGHHYTWTSSSMHYNKNGVGININDLQLGASILFTGNHYSTVKRMFDTLNLQCIHEKTYYRYQRVYFAPVINSFWKNHQSEVLKR